MPIFDTYLDTVRQATREISVEQLQQWLATGDVTVVDVREPDEHRAGVIASARLVPRGVLEMRLEMVQPDRDGPVALVCQGGTRSLLAAATASLLGYTHVVSVSGGMDAWAKAGFSTVVPRLLSASQKARYIRQIVMPDIGEAGQQKICDARVLCVGAGGLGSPLALYLAAAGVGTLGIIDDDVAEASNLQRQILHNERSLGIPKVQSARAALEGLNREVTVRTYEERLTAHNALEIFDEYDIICDGSDNFPTRYLINDACVLLGKPNVHGAVYYFDGQTTVFNHGGGPCYRCLYPEPPPARLAPNCSQAGVLGSVCGVIGTLQATEVLKLIVGTGVSLAGRLLSCDTLNMEFRELTIRPNEACPVCSAQPTITTLVDYERLCASTG